MEDAHETAVPGTVVPADIELISEFVNTVDIGDETDDLTTRKELSGFLHAQGLLKRRTPSSDDELEIVETPVVEETAPLPELPPPASAEVAAAMSSVTSTATGVGVDIYERVRM